MAYLDILYHEAFRSHWSLSNFTLLFITTYIAHQARIMPDLDELTCNRLKKQFLFRTECSFGRFWQIPATPMAGLVTASWYSLTGPVHIQPTFQRCQGASRDFQQENPDHASYDPDAPRERPSMRSSMLMRAAILGQACDHGLGILRRHAECPSGDRDLGPARSDFHHLCEAVDMVPI